MLVAAREVVVHDVKSHFDQEEGPGGHWPTRATERASYKYDRTTAADLPAGISSQSTIRELREAGLTTGQGGPLLVESGAGKAVATARQSYVIEADGLGGSITFDATPPDYMIEHNRGSEGRYTEGGWWEGPNPLPQREWMWLSESAAQGIFQIFEDFVDDAVSIIVNPLTGHASIQTGATGFQSPTVFYG